jgi:hypothetical protein
MYRAVIAANNVTKAFLRQIPLQKSTMSYSLSNQIEQGWCISYNITCGRQTIYIVTLAKKRAGWARDRAQARLAKEMHYQLAINRNKKKPKGWRRYSLGLLWWP